MIETKEKSLAHFAETENRLFMPVFAQIKSVVQMTALEKVFTIELPK